MRTSGTLSAQHAEDQYRIAFLRRYYEARAAEIPSSGDAVRIRLYHEWKIRDEKHREAA